MEVIEKNWITKEMDNLILDEEGKGCILGFIGSYYKISPDKMLGKTRLTEIDIPKELEWLNQSMNYNKHQFGRAETFLVWLNDNPSMTINQKKSNLTGFLKKVGINIKWS